MLNNHEPSKSIQSCRTFCCVVPGGFIFFRKAFQRIGHNQSSTPAKKPQTKGGGEENLFYDECEYTVKKVTDFPVSSRDVTNQTLPGGNNLVIPHQGEFG